MTERITISCPDELAERINARLEYGDNRSELIRELIRDGLEKREDDQSETNEVRSETYEDTTQTPLPGSVPNTVDDNQARAAIKATLSHLQAESTATRADIVANVMPQEPLRYDVPDEPGNYRGSWWRKIVRPALAEHESVEPPKPGGSKYRYNP